MRKLGESNIRTEANACCWSRVTKGIVYVYQIVSYIFFHRCLCQQVLDDAVHIVWRECRFLLGDYGQAAFMSGLEPFPVRATLHSSHWWVSICTYVVHMMYTSSAECIEMEY